MLFDFNSFIEELRDNPDKKDIIEKYEKYVENIEGDVKDQKRYVDYVSQFQTMQYKVPEEIQEDFDRDLLLQLVAASFSSDGVFDFDEEGNTEFVVSVQNGDQAVVKKISELWGFQVLRLFEIYIEEQINLQALMHEDENEKESIESKRDARINRWNLVLENFDKDKLEKQEEQEKEQKLEDLKNQL